MYSVTFSTPYFPEVTVQSPDDFGFLGQLCGIIDAVGGYTGIIARTPTDVYAAYDPLGLSVLDNLHYSWAVRPDEGVFDTHMHGCLIISVDGYDYLLPKDRYIRFVHGYREATRSMGIDTRLTVKVPIGRMEDRVPCNISPT